MADTTRLKQFFWGAVNPSAGVTSWFVPDTTPAPTPPNIVTVVLPLGRVGVPYSAQLTADGTGPFIWSLSPATPNMPAGLALNVSTGAITGTPTEAFGGDIFFRVEGAAGPTLRDTQGIAMTMLGATDPIPDDTPGLPGELPLPPDPTSWVRVPRDAEVWIRVPRKPG
jgi:hypothetical protein